MNILQELAAYARMRVAEDWKRIPLEEMREQAEQLPRAARSPFEAALKKPGMSFICEVKRASPWSVVSLTTSPGSKPSCAAIFSLASTTGRGYDARNFSLSRYIEAL